MSIDVKCPKCGSELEAPDNAAGKKVKCPDCGTAIGVPASEDEAPPRKEAGIQRPKPRSTEERPARGGDKEAVADRPSRRSKEEEDEEDDRPRRRRREEDDDDDDRPRRRRRRNDDDGMSTLIPYKNSKALAAYYCGVFALIPCVGMILGPIALIFGILGLKYVKRRPDAHGTGHAWAGIILGSLVILGHLGVIVFGAVWMAAAKQGGR